MRVLSLVLCLILLFSACDAQVQNGVVGEIVTDNGTEYYVENGSFVEVAKPFDENEAVRFASKIESIVKMYGDTEPTLAIIPDKTYYASDCPEEFVLDHSEMTKVLEKELEGITFAELSDLYTWDSFYLTDLHWRQEILGETAKRIGDALGKSIDMNEFTAETVGTFNGIYSELAPNSSEPLIILNHPDFQDVTVEHFEKECKSVYDLSLIDSDNSYDVFMSGASPLSVVKNPNAPKGTSLLVFRDSFASSIIPLLIPNYETITLVDLRYMHSSLLKQYVPSADGDILFLFSGRVVNNSAMLK